MSSVNALQPQSPSLPPHFSHHNLISQEICTFLSELCPQTPVLVVWFLVPPCCMLRCFWTRHNFIFECKVLLHCYYSTIISKISEVTYYITTLLWGILITHYHNHTSICNTFRWHINLKSVDEKSVNHQNWQIINWHMSNYVADMDVDELMYPICMSNCFTRSKFSQSKTFRLTSSRSLGNIILSSTMSVWDV